jgi:hypothetical protein
MNLPLPIMPYYGAVEDEFAFSFTEDKEEELDEDSKTKEEPGKEEKSLNPVKIRR